MIPPASEFGDPAREHPRLPHGDASAEGAARPGVEDRLQCLAALDAAAILHLERGPRGNALQHPEIPGLRGLRPVQIDHVEPSDAGLLEPQRRFERIVAVGLLPGVVALCQADAAPVDDVRGRYDFDHVVLSFSDSC